MPTPAEQRAIQGNKAVLRQAPSPPENKVILIVHRFPRTHRVTDRLLQNLRIPPERFATTAAPDLQRGIKAAFEAVAKLVSGKSGQFGGLFCADQHGLAPSVSSDTETPNPAANLEIVSSEQVLPHFTAEIVPRATPERSANCFPVSPLFVKATTKEIRSTFIKITTQSFDFVSFWTELYNNQTILSRQE